MDAGVVDKTTDEKKAPKCKLCLENTMDFVGQMNNVDIYTCPKCDSAPTP